MTKHFILVFLCCLTFGAWGQCTISGATSVCVGSSITLTAAGCGSGTATWSSLNNSIATVSGGTVWGVSGGVVNIQYSVSGGGTTLYSITVVPTPTGGTISGSANICTSGTTTLHSSGTTGGTWSSGSTGIATIGTSTGIVTSVSAGSVVMTYSVGPVCGTTATSTFSLNVIAPGASAISGTANFCSIGTTSTYTDATTGGAWTSLYPAIISIVSTSGVATSHAGGTSTITYTVTNACGTATATKNVTVYPPSGAAIAGPSNVCTGATVAYTNPISGGTWSSSLPSVATIDAGGNLLGVSAGTATISYAYYDPCIFATKYSTLSVTVGGPGSISGPLSVCTGHTINLTETYGGGTWAVLSGGGISLSSVAPYTTCTVTATSAAAPTIKYTCSGASFATYGITVNSSTTPPTLTGSGTTVCPGGNILLTGNPGGGTFTSTATGIATVGTSAGYTSGTDSASAYSALGIATTPTTATSGALFSVKYTYGATCPSTTTLGGLTAYALVSAGIISGKTTVCRGANDTLTAVGATSGGTWTSSNPSVGTVSSSGIVTGGSGVTTPTSVTITYTTVTGFCNTASATFTLTVVPPTTAITGPSSVCGGSSITLVDASTGGTWITGDATIATISTTGIVTGAAVTTATSVTIYYTDSNACGFGLVSTLVTVNPTPTIAGASQVCLGSSSTALTGSILGGTWSSSAPAIATISSSGVVTGMAAGTATITYTLSTGCYATKPFTVNALPVITTSPFPVVACGNSITLSAVGAITFTWFGSSLPSIGSPGAGVSLTIASITFSTSSTAIYTVTGVDANFCVGTGYDTVVKPVCDDYFCGDMSYGSGPIYGISGTRGVAGTTTTFPANKYYIYDNTVFDGAVNFSAGSVVAIAPGKIITVANTAALNINNSHLFCCSRTNLWQGIVLSSASSSTGTINVNNNSLIEDAVTAISVNGGYIPSSGNIITADGAIFNRNRIAIDIENFPTSTTGMLFPSTYPFLIRNTVFTSRNLSVLNTGTAIHYPLAWPYVTGTTTALKASWASSNPMVPHYNILSPTGAGTIGGGYGGQYYAALCKDGSRANIGVQLLNTGANTNYLGNSPQSFGGVVIGDNSSYTGTNQNLNVFDTLMEGIYAKYSNFSASNNLFVYMYQLATPPTYPLLAGDGIGAVATPTTASSTTAYPKYSMEVSGALAPSAVTNNRFYDCRRGVNSYGYYYVTGKNSEIYSTHSTTYPTGQYGYYISTPLYYQVNIRGNTLTNLVTGISMNSAALTSGSLYQFAGNLNISNNTIQSRYGGLPPIAGQYTTTGITATNLYSGSLFATTGIAHIDTNTMYYVYNGINVNGYASQPITSDTNFIIMNHPATMAGSQYGITHANCKNNAIRNNQIIGPGATSPAVTSTYSSPVMVGIFGSSNVSSAVTCNFTDSLNTGFQFFGAGNLTAWRNNVMKDHSYGMVLQNSFGAQGSAAAASYNEWRGGLSAWTGARYNIFTLNGTAPSDMIYVVNNVTPYVYDPMFNKDITGFSYNAYGFATTGTGNGLTVNTGTPTPPSCVALHASPTYYAMLPLVMPGLTVDQPGKALNFIAQNSLFRLMQLDSSYADSSGALEQFQSLAAGSRYAWLSNIENAITSGDDSTARSLLSIGIDTYVDTARDTTTGVVVTDDTVADYIVSNYISLYNEYLLYRDSAMTGADTAIVVALANLCPYTHGQVVYQARALYKILFEDDTTVFNDLCGFDTTAGADSSGARKAITSNSKINQQYKLFPNPNSGNFILEQSVSDDNPVLIEVRDVLGKIVYKQKNTFKSCKLQIILGNIVPGLYVIQISDGKGLINNLKMSIQ